ncbi:hypothetical protein [Fibrobacter sp. UWH4]|nr:hypothetical protein [Fibrobacter sp. UWH4]
MTKGRPSADECSLSGQALAKSSITLSTGFNRQPHLGGHAH